MASSEISHINETLWSITMIVTFMFLVSTLFPISHVIYNIWLKRHGCCGDPDQATITVMNTIGLLSLISYLLHISQHAFFLMNASSQLAFINLNKQLCLVNNFLSNTLFYIGKSFMFTYFILRAESTFHHTNLRYNKKTIIIVTITIFAANTGLNYAFVKLWSQSIITRKTNLDGTICSNEYSDTNTNDINLILLIIDWLSSTIFSLITLYMLIGKLFQLANVGGMIRTYIYFIYIQFIFLFLCAIL